MNLEDWKQYRKIINDTVKKYIKALSKEKPECVFCGTTEKVRYLKWTDDLVCEGCREEILE